MPTVLRIGAARFFFYSNEGDEPPHVHVDVRGAVAKFWLDPVSFSDARGMRRHELRQLEQQVTRHRARLLAAWHEHFRT